MGMQPKLRFKGFTDDWEKRKLLELATFSKGQGYSKKDLVSSGYPIILYGRLYTNYQVSITTVNDTFVANNKNAVISEIGDVIVPGSGETAEDISRASSINIAGIILGGDLNVIHPYQDRLDSTFLALNISNGVQQKELTKRAQGKSIVHIHNSDLQTITLKKPELYEQQKISKLFIYLDNLITVNQRKVDLLKKKKNGYLQKLFPENGQNNPELRFKGYTDAWEKRKLENFTKSYSGGTPSISRSDYYGGEIPFIRSAEINSDSTDLYLTEIGLKNSSAKMVQYGDILYALYGATSGEVGIARIHGAINQAILAIKPTDGDDSQFIMQWLRKQKGHIINTYLQGGQGNLSGSIVKSLEVRTPVNKNEEFKIGSLLKKIDNLITVNQDK